MIKETTTTGPKLGRRPGPWINRRGGVLLAAALFAGLIAISLMSYIKLALGSLNMAQRSFYQNSAVNLAEVGVEEALYCYNKLNDVPAANPEQAWLPYGWTIAGDNSVSRTLSGFSVGPGVTGEVKIYCSLHNPTTPTQMPVVVAQATVSFPSGPSLSKYLEVTLRKRSLFPRGMVVRKTIDTDGHSLSLDSWDSQDDGNPATPMVTYSDTTRRANATIATQSTTNDAISIGNGVIYGYIATASRGDPSLGDPTVEAGPTAVLTGNFSSTEFDTNRISHDFEVITFPQPTTPSGGTAITANIGATTFPRAGDIAAADGVYYYRFGVGAGIAVNNNTLQISGKVVLILENHSGVDAVVIGGGGGMTIDAGASLKIYTNGNISIAGSGGLSNGNKEPSTCVFFGTHPTDGGQSFSVKGNSETSISLYGPNANITITGGGSGGDFFGAIVGNTVQMNGTTRFHYDEALGRLYTGEPFGVAKWRELRTASERDAYTAKLTF